MNKNKQDRINGLLMEAVCTCNAQAVVHELGRGADPNKIIQAYGFETTPMSMLARTLGTGTHSEQAGLEVLEKLLRGGARPTLGALDLSSQFGLAKVLETMANSSDPSRRLSARAQIYGTSAAHSKPRCLDVLERLHGPIPYMEVANGVNLLMLACSAKPSPTQLETVEKVLASGKYDVNSKGAKDNNSLHSASCGEVSELLLSLGADPNQRTKVGKTPLFYVHDPKQIDTLIGAGANVGEIDNQGRGAVWTMWARGVEVEVISHAIERGVSFEGDEPKIWHNNNPARAAAGLNIIKAAGIRYRLTGKINTLPGRAAGQPKF